ncbi:hypothetical protein [Actinoplanes couchii]|uniref:hypothetical protein n=1 Tax=Actinoplanes couchii TaxID=403638 RepID=UPI0019424029|nr:hypothetical protein [Actinoplanes couchii]
MIRLEVDTTDPVTRRQVEKLFGATWQLRRALQRQAGTRVDAYWAAGRLRSSEDGPKLARERFGLSRSSLEQAAAGHVDRSGWLGRHLTKALAMHLADEVWETVDRHLFADKIGNRHGRPRVGTWWASTRIPGRARSHTKPNTWETFRLVGSLDAYRTTFPAQRPSRIPVPARPPGLRGWWDYDGPLTVVFPGAGPRPDLVLPVRLPHGPAKQSRLQHFLGRPQVWHKIDLVRVEDPKAPGGWRYYAHLMILDHGWTSPSVREQRVAAPRDRVGGVDGNVSNLAVASMPADPTAPGGLHTSMVAVDDVQRAAAEQVRLTARRRQRALDRSRRNSNPGQYELSKRQQKRATRRADAGLLVRQVPTPLGPRVANAAGIPKQAYRRDRLSAAYRRRRAEHAAAGRSGTQAKQARAQHIARTVVTEHGPNLVVEHTNIRAWAKLWGRGIALFSPGMLIAALKLECAVAAGQLLRAGTTQTALSQQCPCGVRAKKPLGQRTHRCGCGIVGDRDVVAAAMGACVQLADPDQPGTARINETLRAALAARIASTGLQEVLARSTATTGTPPRVPAGTAAPHQRRGASAEQTRAVTTGRTATPDETPRKRRPRGNARARKLHAVDPGVELRLNS